MAVGTCYAIGNEITGFVTTGSVVVGSATTRPQSGSRCTIHVAPAAAADPPTNFFQFAQNWGPASSFFTLSVLTWSALGGSADLNATLIEFKDSSGVARLMVRGAGSGAVKLSKRTAAGAFIDLATSPANSMPLTGLTPIAVNTQVVYTGNITSGARTDVSFTAGPPGVISTAGGNFVTDGFVQGSIITVSGSTVNDGVYTVASVGVGSMTLIPSEGLTAEVAGASITITSTGYMELRLADNLVVSYTGDVTTDSATALAQIAFSNCNISNGIDWSEEWVSSVTLLNATVFSLPPLAPGVNQTWAGTVSDIDSVAINDTNFISDGTVGDLSGWTVATALPTGAWQIQAFAQEARLSAGNTGPQHFDFYLRSATTDSLYGDDLGPPVGSFENFSNAIWSVSPVTTASWTIAEFTAGLNFGLKSLA
jgi:hypothetical protein